MLAALPRRLTTGTVGEPPSVVGDTGSAASAPPILISRMAKLLGKAHHSEAVPQQTDRRVPSSKAAVLNVPLPDVGECSRACLDPSSIRRPHEGAPERRLWVPLTAGA